jgi:hypothetical protein
MAHKIFYLTIALLLCSILLISCTSSKYISNEELKIPHDLLIIPYKAGPMVIRAMTTGGATASGLLFIGLPTVMEHSAKGDKEKYVELLEKMRRDWNPSAAMAKECSSLIKNNQKAQITNIAVANVRELPGMEEFRLEEPKVFSSSMSEFSSWSRFAIRTWLPSDLPTIKYKREYHQSKADWALEVFLTPSRLDSENVGFRLLMKIFDINTGEKIAAILDGGEFNVSSEILPIKDELDFKKFEEEFGIAARQVCGKALIKIGLINFSEK